MPAGRPTDYKKGYIQEVDKYLAENEDEWNEYHKTRGVKSDSYEMVMTVKLPSRVGFASYLDTTRETLDNWSQDHKEFLYALKKIDAEQQTRLVNEGLAGNYNPAISKLLLSANHGLSERTETDVTSGGEKIDGFVVKFVTDAKDS